MLKRNKLSFLTLAAGLVFFILQPVLAEEFLTITNAAAAVKGNEITISWNTNLAATAWIEFGETAAYGASAGLAGQAKLSHSLTLKSLKEKTTYHYKILAAAAEQTVATFDQTFKTGEVADIVAPVISNLKVPYVTGSTAVIQWETNEEASSVVEYGKTASYGKSKTGTDKTKNHEVILTGLAKSTTYYFKLKSADKKGNEAIFASRTFTTDKNTVAEQAELTIYNLRPLTINDPLIGDTYVTFSWETNKLADGAIYYGIKSDALKKVSVGSLKSFIHQLKVTDLKPATSYYFKVEAKDIFNKTETSSLSRLQTTDNAVRLSDVAASEDFYPVVSLTAAQKNDLLSQEVITAADLQVRAIKFTWNVNLNAACKVLYKFRPISQKTFNYQASNKSDWQSSHNYSYLIAPWEGDYHYKVGCFDKVKNPNRVVPAFYSEVKVFEYRFKDSLANGAIVKEPNSPKVFRVWNGQRYWIADFKTLSDRGWVKDIKVVSEDILRKYPVSGSLFGKYDEGTLIKANNNPTVYLLTGKYKRPVTTAEVFVGAGYRWADIKTVAEADLNYYQNGLPIRSVEENILEGSLVKAPGQPSVYLVENRRLKSFTNEQAYLDNVFDWEAIKNITPAQVQALAKGEVIAN